MAVYSLGDQRATIGASGSAMWEYRTASTDRALITELAYSGPFATSGSAFGIGRPAAIGVNPTSPITWLAEEPGDPVGTVQIASAWTTTAPTAPTAFFRRHLTFGAYVVIWEFPLGLTIAVSSSIVLWTITLGTSQAVDMFVRGEE